MSITFVGFSVSGNGDLTDPVSGKVLERASMKPQLYAGLKRNGVNLSENYQLWDKQTMIQKIGMVMGLECVSDPDPSYVLTVDNVIKMLAIQMRFRCIMALLSLRAPCIPSHHFPTQVQHSSGDHGRDRLWQDPPHQIHD